MTDTDIHSCGYYCDRPLCIKAQRDELRNKLFSDQAVKTYEPVIDKSMAKRIATQLGWEPKREWVGLTNDEAADFVLFHAVVDEECVRAIEAKLKEKNT